MRKIGLVILLALLVATAVQAASASPATTGSKLSMYRGNLVYRGNLDRPIKPNVIQFAANSPFYVQHGWVVDWSFLSNEEKQAFISDNTRFDLYVDGVEQASIPDHTFDESNGDIFFIKLSLTNYPDGMTGTHLFRGEWWIDGFLIGEDPGEAYLDLVSVLQVDFV